MPQIADRHAHADAKIAVLYDDQAPLRRPDAAIQLKIDACIATLAGDADQTAAFCRLVYGATPARRLVTVEPASPALGVRRGNTGLDALLHLARHSAHWTREPEDWTPKSGAAQAARIADLARHLLQIYETPAFLDNSWLLGLTDDAEAYRRWFTHIAQGEKLEAIRFPMPITHRAAHYFLRAPPDFTVPAAMRWGQIRALGGSESLARAVSETFLAELRDDEAFWATVVAFFVHQRHAVPNWQVAPCADFIRHRKEQEPNFTMRGRTGAALLARVAEWNETRARLQIRRETWPATPWLNAFERTEPDNLSKATAFWAILEITDTVSMAEEGREMRHCVRTYAKNCAAGRSSLWSLRLNLSDNRALRRLLTLEIDTAARAVVQVRGKCNQTLAHLTSGARGTHRMVCAREILREWAARERLYFLCEL